MATHKSWRLYVDAPQAGQTAASIAELVLKDVAAAVIDTTAGSYYASSEFDANWVAGNAFDLTTGDSGNAWASVVGTGADEYVGVVLASAVDPVTFEITARTAFSGDAPKDFRLQFSDDTITNQTEFDNATWVDVFAVSNQTGWTATEIRAFTIGVTLDPTNIGAGVVLSNGDLTFANSASVQRSGTTAAPKNSTTESVYFEVTSNTTVAGGGKTFRAGVAKFTNRSDELSLLLGSTVGSFSYSASANSSNYETRANGVVVTTLAAPVLTSGDTYGFHLHDDTLDIYKLFGTTGLIDSVAVEPGDYEAAVGSYNATVTANFGATAFVGSIPFGSASWDGSQSNTVVTLDPTNTGANLTLSNGDLSFSNVTAIWHSSYASLPRSTGKYYFEVTLDSGSFVMIGASNVLTLSNFIGFSTTSASYNSSGATRKNNVVGATLATWGAGETVGLLFDGDADELYFLDKNDVLSAAVTLVAGDFYAGVSAFSSAGTVNFGASAFAHTIPVGYTSWDGSQENLSTDVIAVRIVTDATPGGAHANWLEWIVKDSLSNVLTDVASGGTPFHSSSQIPGVTDSDKAFDDVIAGDLYAGSTAVGDGWIMGKILGTPFSGTLGDYDLISRLNAAGANTTPISWHVETSVDTTTGLDGTWVLVHTVVGEAAWSTNETRNFVINGPQGLELTGPIVETTNITDWDVHAFSLDGTTHLTVTATGVTYNIPVVLDIPYIVTGLPSLQHVWAAGVAIASGDYITSETTPHIWVAGGAGTTGGSEPTWNLTGTTVDNDITWTYVEELVQPVSQAPLMPTPV